MKGALLAKDVEARVVAVHGEPGAAWLRQLPGPLQALSREWALVRAGPPFTDARASLVVPVSGPGGTPLVLKLAPSAR